MTTPRTETAVHQVCGLRTLHVERAGLTRATLFIGAGWADETFATRGVGHVVEHLVMSRTTRGAFEANASVAMHSTAFWATGRPEQVARFLAEVTAAIRDLPLDRLEHEAKVLEAEARGQEPGFGPHEAMLKARFGHEGPGLGMFWGSGPAATDATVVAEHARRWFVRDNAVLAVVGPMPEDLDVHLPDGEVPVRELRDHSSPGVVTFGVEHPVLSFVMPDGPAVNVVNAMAQRLEETLRHDRGQVYAVSPEFIRLPGTGDLLVQIAAQVAPGAAGPVAEALAHELAHRAEIGIESDELELLLEWWDAADAEPDDVDDVANDAERLLCGLPLRTRAEARAAVAALDREEVARIVRDASATALLLVPPDVEPRVAMPKGSMCAVTSGMTTPTLRRRLRSGAPKGTALGHAGDVVEFRDEDGDVHAIRFADVVGVGVDGPGRELIGRRGCFIVVDPRDFAGAAAVVRAIDEHVPQTYRFDLAAWLGVP